MRSTACHQFPNLFRFLVFGKLVLLEQPTVPYYRIVFFWLNSDTEDSESVSGPLVSPPAYAPEAARQPQPEARRNAREARTETTHYYHIPMAGEVDEDTNGP